MKPALYAISLNFLRHVRMGFPGGCWEWTGSKLPGGYGQIHIWGHGMKAHRVAWMLKHDTILPVGGGQRGPIGQIVIHTCDNPGCVNPRHLRLANQSENALDRERKGRGSRVGLQKAMAYMIERARLSPEQVREIRVLRTRGMTSSTVGRRFGISQELARLIGLRLRYAWVSD
mgnify:FL=1